VPDLLEPALNTFINAAVAWVLLLILVAGLLLLEIATGRINLVCIARSLGPLGLFPYFLFISVLIMLFPDNNTEPGSFSVYLPQIVCSVLAAAFSTVYAASIRHAANDTRIVDLLKLVGPHQFYGRLTILAPFGVSSFIVAMKTGWPLIVLMTILFEWGRGKGLGALLQGRIMSGTWNDVAGLIVIISLMSGSIYGLLEILDRYVRRRLLIETVDFFSPESAVDSPQRQRNALFCLATAAALFLMAWELAFHSSPSLDPSYRYHPLRFITELVSPGGRVVGEGMSGRFAEAVWNSILFALAASVIGPVVAVLCALMADRSKAFNLVMSVLTNVSQAVPIFVFIPALWGAFKEPWLVAIVILASATYFRGYEYVRGELANSCRGWKELVALAGRPVNLKARIVRFRRIIWPIVWRAAIRGAVLVFPYSITAAAVADLFVNLGGLGRLASYDANGDLPLTLAACLAILVIGMSGELLASRLARSRGVPS
jgi:ABC-type nitrate/sulfonate/bicarbonate transport system permease component